MATKKALVVDNDRLYVELLSDILEDNGYAAIKAYDGMEAIERIREEPALSVIFVDLIMPKVDGARLCKYIKDDPERADTPVVVLSATVLESKAKLADIGADVYVAKGPLEEVKRNIVEILRLLDKNEPIGGTFLPAPGKSKSRFVVSELLSHTWHMELMIERMGEGVIEVDTAWKIVWMNPAALEIFGKPEVQLVGSPLTDLLDVESSRKLRDLQESLSASGEATQETATVSHGDKTLKLNVTNLIVDSRNVGFLILVQDITPLITQINALEEAQSGLFNSAKLSALGQLSANLSHEINARLSNILGHTSVLLHDGDKGESHRKALSLIQDEVLHARGFIKEFLNMVYQVEPKPAAVSPAQELKTIIQLVRNKAKSLGVRISEKYEKELPSVQGYPSHLKLAFLNIINNAFDAMPKGGTLTIEAKKKDGHILILFKDTGCGVPPQTLNKLFNPFFTTKDRNKYFGLGLSITLGIMQRHQGNIEIKSDEAKGTVLTVTLPIHGGRKETRVR